MSFVHLRVYSDYSFGDGAIKIQDLVSRCKDTMAPAVCLSDKNNMFGALEFSMAATKSGIQPIIGLDITVEGADHLVGNNILLIAKNDIGLQNLFALSTLYYDGNRQGVLKQKIQEHSDGLIAICGMSEGSMIQNAYKHKRGIQSICKEYKDIFSEDFYIEIVRTTKDERLENELLDIAQKLNIPIVATNAVAFIEQDMTEAHDALLCIVNSRYIIEDQRPRSNPSAYFKSASSMIELFKDLPEAIENTANIAKKCHTFCKPSKPMFPSFGGNDTGANEDDMIKRLSEEGLNLRISHIQDAEIRKKYTDRLEMELSVIIKMQYSGYFLIVSDFIRWSKKNGIPVGPGRGSGAGSVVAWSLDITGLDPLQFGLLFERFLNPDRVSMPDFDIDFCQHRRDEVIEYVKQKYGANRVAKIITFGKLQARAVLRDVGRVLHLPYSRVDKICKMVPNNPAHPVTLQEAIDLDKDLRDEGEKDQDIAKLMEISLKLEGTHRHVSTHAAGIVIADRDICEIMPLYKDHESEMYAVQYSMKYAEEAGLVKFDFLGLKTLTLIKSACQLIDSSFDILKIPVDDKKTFEILSSGDTKGVFQFDGAGMKEVIRKFKPDKLEDLIALTSLYRPGPMDNIPSYIERKLSQKEPSYIHPKLADVLKETYGIIVYQEQVMEIARVLAGYTLGQADLLRRAMGKKIKSEMDKQKSVFVSGCAKNDISKAKAEEIFVLVEKFASYGFNKSHAAAYSIIAYQSGYLKANYRIEFITASINLEIDDTDKIGMYYQEAKKTGMKLLPPDINKSQALFSIEGDSIRYGLAGIKNTGIGAVTQIIKERDKNGPFKSILDIARRTDVLNKKIIEALSKANAFVSFEDSTNHHCALLFTNAEKITRYSTKHTQEKNIGQLSLFEEEDDRLILNQKVEKWDGDQMLQMEFEALGFHLSSHPLSRYEKELKILHFINSTMIQNIESELQNISIAGVIMICKIKSSNKGKYAFLQLSDLDGVFEVAIFDEPLLIRSQNLLFSGSKVAMQISAKKMKQGLRVIAHNIYSMQEISSKIQRCVNISIKSNDDDKIDFIHSLLSQDGNINVSSIAINFDNGFKALLQNEDDISKYMMDQVAIDKLKSTDGITLEEFYHQRTN